MYTQEKIVLCKLEHPKEKESQPAIYDNSYTLHRNFAAREFFSALSQRILLFVRAQNLPQLCFILNQAVGWPNTNALGLQVMPLSWT